MNSSDLTLSICLYNADKYIEETLACIISQTFQNFHLLIINDCSSDNSNELVEQFFLKYPREYKMINFPENKGIGYARHYAERYVTTKYMYGVNNQMVWITIILLYTNKFITKSQLNNDSYVNF